MKYLLFALLLIPVTAIAAVVFFGFIIIVFDVILWALRGFQDFGL